MDLLGIWNLEFLDSDMIFLAKYHQIPPLPKFLTFYPIGLSFYSCLGIFEVCSSFQPLVLLHHLLSFTTICAELPMELAFMENLAVSRAFW